MTRARGAASHGTWGGDLRARAATVTWILVAVATVTAALIDGATAGLAIPDSWGFRGGILLLAAVFGAVGAIITRRRPGNRIGTLFLGCGLLSAVQGLATAYVETGVFALHGGLPYIDAVGWLLTRLWVPTIGLATIGLPLLVPDGHLLSRAWRPVAVFAVVGLSIQAVAFALEPGPIPQAVYLDNPLGLADVDPAAPIFLGVFLTWPIASGLAIVSQVNRWRNARAEARQQLKWFALAALLVLATALAYSVSVSISGPKATALSQACEIALVVSILAIPVAAGIAVLRYRLYEIDRVISRTIGWAIVTGVLVAVFAGLVVTLQAVLAPVTRENTLAVAASTLVAFALFQPLRRRVQRAVDRRFDRARYDGERIIATFGERLRDQVDLATLRASLSATANDAVRPSGSTVWLRNARDSNSRGTS